MRIFLFLSFLASVLFCATTSKTPPQSKPQEQTTNPLTSKTSQSPSVARWFIGVGSGANYSFKYEKPFAIVDFKSGLTYDNEWGQSYMYANISYAYLQNWDKNAQKSQGYFIDTLFNTDLRINLFESPSFSFLLMFGVGIGGRWIEQSYNTPNSFDAMHDSFFITNLNIGMRMEICKEHVLSLTLKPQLAKGWYENRQLTFEYFREMSLLLSYTFWKF